MSSPAAVVMTLRPFRVATINRRSVRSKRTKNSHCRRSSGRSISQIRLSSDKHQVLLRQMPPRPSIRPPRPYATRNLLGDAAELLKRAARPTANAEFQSLEIIDGVDLLAEPAAHLRAGVTGRRGVEIELLDEFVDEFVASCMVEPRILLTGVRAEGQRAGERESWVLTDVVIRSGMTQLDCAGLNSV
jgi:hypothetical protein